MSAWDRQLDDLKVEALSVSNDASDPSSIPRRVVRGWLVLFSHADGLFNLSCSLYPRGRSSTEVDWNALGAILAKVGAPKDSVHFPDDPNGVVHAVWLGGKS